MQLFVLFVGFLGLFAVVPHITDAIQEWVEKVAHIPVDESNEPPQVFICSQRAAVSLKSEAYFLAL